MSIEYNRESDTLTVVLGPASGPLKDFASDDIVATAGGDDALAELSISNASAFLASILAAGVRVEGAPDLTPPEGTMAWYPAESSVISAYGYDPHQRVLDVAFRAGVYRYFDVPPDEVQGLHEAPSKGRYLRGHIIDRYAYERRRLRTRKQP